MLDGEKGIVLNQILTIIAYTNCDKGYGFKDEQFIAECVWIDGEECKTMPKPAIRELIALDYIGIVKDEWGEIFYLTPKTVELTGWKCSFWKGV